MAYCGLSRDDGEQRGGDGSRARRNTDCNSLDLRVLSVRGGCLSARRPDCETGGAEIDGYRVCACIVGDLDERDLFHEIVACCRDEPQSLQVDSGGADRAASHHLYLGLERVSHSAELRVEAGLVDLAGYCGSCIDQSHGGSRLIARRCLHHLVERIQTADQHNTQNYPDVPPDDSQVFTNAYGFGAGPGMGIEAIEQSLIGQGRRAPSTIGNYVCHRPLLRKDRDKRGGCGYRAECWGDYLNCRSASARQQHLVTGTNLQACDVGVRAREIDQNLLIVANDAKLLEISPFGRATCECDGLRDRCLGRDGVHVRCPDFTCDNDLYKRLDDELRARDESR